MRLKSFKSLVFSFPTTVLQEASEAKEAKSVAEAKPSGSEAQGKDDGKKDRDAVQVEFQ